MDTFVFLIFFLYLLRTQNRTHIIHINILLFFILSVYCKYITQNTIEYIFCNTFSILEIIYVNTVKV